MNKLVAPSPSLFAFIILFAFLIRLAGLNKGIWLDEASSIELINRPDFLTALQHYDHPPLYFVLLKLWGSLSQAEVWLRLFSVICSVGVVGVMLKWLKPFQAALVAAVLTATLPIMLEYAHEIRNYALLLLLTSLAFYFTTHLIEQDTLFAWAGLSLSLMGVVTTHLVGVIVLPSILIFGVISYRLTHAHWLNYRFLSRIGLALTLAATLFLGLYFYFLPPELQARSSATWWMPAASWSQVVLTLKYLLGIGNNSLRSLILTPLGFTVSLGLVLWLMPLMTGSWRVSLPFFAAALTYWLGLFVVSTLSAPIFIPRTALPGLIPFLAGFGQQLATISNPKLKVWSISGLLVLSSYTSLTWLTHTAWQPIERWQPIAQALQTAWQPDDLVIFYPAYIETPTRYYWSALSQEKTFIPPQSIVTIWIGGDLNKLNQTREQVNLIEARQFTSAVFLVWRNDQNIAHEPEVLAELHHLLADKFGSPQVLAQADQLMVWKYARH